jgi:Flp pilus assembly pilin Flp
MRGFWNAVWLDETGEDIAEYAVMLAVILVLVVRLVRLIGSNASNIFSQVGSTIQEANENPRTSDLD